MGSGLGHIIGDAIYRTFHIKVRIIQNRHAQALQPRCNFFFQNTQSLFGMARHQNTFALCEKMPHQVCNGVSFASTRRPLHQNSIVLLDTVCDFKLLFVGLFRK